MTLTFFFEESATTMWASKNRLFFMEVLIGETDVIYPTNYKKNQNNVFH